MSFLSFSSLYASSRERVLIGHGANINVPLFAALYFGWKVAKRTKVWKPHEMDFVTGIPTVEETEEPERPPVTIGEKIAAVLF